MEGEIKRGKKTNGNSKSFMRGSNKKGNQMLME